MRRMAGEGTIARSACPSLRRNYPDQVQRVTASPFGRRSLSSLRGSPRFTARVFSGFGGRSILGETRSRCSIFLDRAIRTRIGPSVSAILSIEDNHSAARSNTGSTSMCDYSLSFRIPPGQGGEQVRLEQLLRFTHTRLRRSRRATRRRVPASGNGTRIRPGGRMRTVVRISLQPHSQSDGGPFPAYQRGPAEHAP